MSRATGARVGPDGSNAAVPQCAGGVGRPAGPSGIGPGPVAAGPGTRGEVTGRGGRPRRRLVGRVVGAVVVGGQVQVDDVDIDLDDVETGHLLDRADHVAPDGAGQLGDRRRRTRRRWSGRPRPGARRPRPTTPWVDDARAPGMRSVIAPNARAAPPPKPWTPGSSRAASAATLDTTASAMVVLPWLVSSGFEPAAAGEIAPAPTAAPLLAVLGHGAGGAHEQTSPWG